MLDLISIHNIEIENLTKTEYDIGIFASGYESRSSALIDIFNPLMFKSKLAFGFAEYADNEIRLLNDKKYLDKGFEKIHIVEKDDETKIYKILIELFDGLKSIHGLKVLLDYTSMPRTWYSGILNFFRLQTQNSIEVYINYCPGLYEKNQTIEYSYSSINALAYHEGSLSSNSKTLLVFGIGFSPYLIKSIIEEIEPNELIGILPIPSAKEEYIETLLKIKEDLLVKDINHWINCPVHNLDSIFRTYAEITNNNINSKDILFLSLGPKILTMASILVGQRFKHVTNLYLKTTTINPLDIKAEGSYICNKILYKK